MQQYPNHPARFYRKTATGVRCMLCPHRCHLEEGEWGKCHTRLNVDGELYTRAYGNPCAVHIDPIEKKPLYHFLPGTSTFSIGTAGCNLACLNCQNWEISRSRPDELPYTELMPRQVARVAQQKGCASVAYTYTDPVAFYEYTCDSAAVVHEAGLKNVVVSAGYIEEPPLREWCRWVDAANIDLKGFSNENYKKLSSASLKPVLNTLEVLQEEGVWVEITNLIVPQWSDSPDSIRQMCRWLVDNGFEEAPLHFSRFFPTHKLRHLPPTPLETLVHARELALEAGIRYVYIGNVPNNNGNDTRCPSCRKKVIRRPGFRIIENLLEEGACPFCRESIAGIW